MKKIIMNAYVNSTLCFTIFLLFCSVWISRADALACDSCGRECASACGTKHFRTCCFNYLRKRSDPIESASSNTNVLQNPQDILATLDSRLEAWIRDSKDLQYAINEAINLNKISTMKKRRLNSDEFFELP